MSESDPRVADRTAATRVVSDGGVFSCPPAAAPLPLRDESLELRAGWKSQSTRKKR